MYEFTKDCMIGIKEIDDEHKKLFDMINDAMVLTNETEDAESIAKNLIKGLKDYADVHFAHEEAYMKKINKKKIFFVSITFLITLCLLFYFIFSYYSTPIQPRTIHKKNKKNTSYPTVSFVAVGDNIIHENVYQYALKQGNDTTYNFKPCYQNLNLV